MKIPTQIKIPITNGNCVTRCFVTESSYTDSTLMNIDIEYHLLAIAYSDQDEKEGKKSFKILYEEFRGFVYNLSFKFLYSKLHKEEFAKSITNEVFLHIYKNPTEWSYKEEAHRSSENAFKAYLSTIVRIKMLEQIKESKDRWDREDVITDDKDFFNVDLTHDEIEFLDKELSNNHKVIEEILLTFSERDREIILTYFKFFEVGKNLPSEVLDSMEKEHSTTRPNIRQIVSRAKRAIKAKGELKIKKYGDGR